MQALIVLEYLVAHGSERVIDDIREHAYQISVSSLSTILFYSSVLRKNKLSTIFFYSSVSLNNDLTSCFTCVRRCQIFNILIPMEKTRGTMLEGNLRVL